MKQKWSVAILASQNVQLDAEPYL